jgi:ABC-type Fe3+-siderophore transport system permease subunit
MRYRKSFVTAGIFVFICVALSGCVTTGSVPAEIVTQSSAVDTSVSQLQTQQTETAVITQSITDTAQSISTIASKINNTELTEKSGNLSKQVADLTASITTERNKTTQIQENYTALKKTSGNELVNQSTKINKLAAQLKLAHKWIWILAGVIVIMILAAAGYIFIKFYFHK